MRLTLISALALTLSTTSTPEARLSPPTVAAFDRYVEATSVRMAAEREGRAPFLWIDHLDAGRRREALAALTAGEVVTERLRTRPNGRDIDVPDGMIHHWIGTVLLPGATMDQAQTFVRDYGRYPSVFAPLVVRTRVTNATGDQFDVTMRTRMEKVKTVVVDADYRISYQRLSPTRIDSVSIASNVFEVSDAGLPTERRVPGPNGDGFLWRLNTYCRFEQRPEGTYEQCESISLTRDIPFGLGWLIGPFVTGIPREALAFTLGQVRRGVTGA